MFHSDHFRTMLWLRWRLTQNQWARRGRLNAVITLVAAAFGVGLAIVGGLAGTVGGFAVLHDASPTLILVVWDGLVAGFLFLWVIGLVTELQRSELIDLGRLMHLPVSLREVFLLNYLASHFTLSLVILLPTMAGLAVGLSIGRGWMMALLVPLVFGFFFMITAWTYCLRGWLASLMVNPRRRRAIIMGITFTFILAAQTPNLVINVWWRPDRTAHGRASPWHLIEQRPGLRRAVVLAHRVVPLLWLPAGARELADGRPWPALLAAAGLFGLGAIGLRRAYRATVRFYLGAEAAKPARRERRPAVPVQPGRILLERRLPLVPNEAAAVALGTFRSMTRAPEVKMALAMNLAIFCIVGVMVFLRGPGKVPEAARAFVATGAVGITLLGLIQLLFNQFGFDRDGFRALVLSPARRSQMLLGKNLALLPPAGAAFAVYLVLVAVVTRPPALTMLAACLQFVAAILALSALGNLVSILLPYRVAPGSMKPTKTKATTTAMMVVVQLLFPLTLAPILIPPGAGLLSELAGWLPGAVVNLLLSSLLALLSVALYALTLAPLGGLLERREQRVLEAVTQEVE